MREERLNLKNRTITTLKTPSTPFPPNAPHYAMSCEPPQSYILMSAETALPEDNTSMTLCSITQRILNKLNTKDHNSYAIGQWRRRRSTDSPHRLHIQHKSITMILLFRRLSINNILPNAADQEKNATLGGTVACHTIFKGMTWHSMGIECDTNLKISTHSWLPIDFITTITPHRLSIDHFHKQGQGF